MKTLMSALLLLTLICCNPEMQEEGYVLPSSVVCDQSCFKLSSGGLRVTPIGYKRASYSDFFFVRYYPQTGSGDLDLTESNNSYSNAFERYAFIPSEELENIERFAVVIEMYNQGLLVGEVIGEFELLDAGVSCQKWTSKD